MGKAPDQIDPGELDNHGKPALVVDRQGYIHLVFGSHGGDPKYGANPLGEFFMGTKGKMTHVVSAKPGDISAWRVVDNLPAHGTYNQWVKLANGDLYLFYRHGGHRSDWVYQKSTDGGLAWLKGSVAITSKDRSFTPSALIRNAHPDAVVLLSSRSAAEPHLYRRMHLVGARGPLGRPAAEASHLGDRLEQIKLLPPPNEAKAEAKRKKKLGLGDDEP